MEQQEPAIFGRQWPSLDLRAGVLPYRLEGVGREYLVIRRRGQAGWAIPKGRLMGFRKATESARLEAYQEAGIHGQVGNAPLGSYVHVKDAASHGGLSEAVEVIVFPMEVARVEMRWPEMDFRERRWVSLNEAAELVASAKLRELIASFDSALAPVAA
jgi:8-oxo-dGTP pyrophosphatase MutT (NUDIX family)